MQFIILPQCETKTLMFYVLKILFAILSLWIHMFLRQKKRVCPEFFPLFPPLASKKKKKETKHFFVFFCFLGFFFFRKKEIV